MSAHVAILEEFATQTNVAARAELPDHASRSRELGTHEPLFLEGDDARSVFEILSGAVCCFRVLADGRRQVISFAYPGDVIGLEHSDWYQYSCEATCPSEIRLIAKDNLFREANMNPDIGRRMLERSGDQTMRMLDHFVLLGRKSALEKVASFLLALTRRHADEDALTARITLPMTRADIADYLGITNETVSRCLTKLRLRGIIEIPMPQTILVRDIDALEELGEQET